MDGAEEDREETVDFDNLLQRVSPQALAGGWEVVEERAGLQILRRTTGDVSLLQARYELPVILEDAAVLCRPEVFFNRCRPEYDAETAECNVDEAIAPGDAVIHFTINSAAEKTVSRAVLGTAALQPPPGLPTGNGAPIKMRWMLRRQCPREGELVALAAPVCPQSGKLLEEYGPIMAQVAKLEAKPNDPSCTLVTEVRRIGLVPSWALSKLVRHFSTKHAWVPAFRASPHWRLALEDPNGFVVLSIRKCPRGPPLLPKLTMLEDTPDRDPKLCALESDPSHWVAAPRDFELPSYLMEFFARLGVTVVLHQSWDGLRLIHYQAAVQRKLWLEVWPAVDAAWKVQRAAYRRLHGGTCAPEIAAGLVAKFVPNTFVPPVTTGEREGAKRIPVVRTFLHFGEGPGPARPRVGSDPAIQTAPS